ncbi:MAG TPA: TonB family protein [Chitinophagales bacterium]|nr:TonB family protein [Chitinophagales bacterium]HMZ89718.1 TonB family protein [Chitinophagales bacterium]HNA58894.1 TonB family protein [Chitinophagales bacterium]HNE46491.1 TonB family protein [Chitinophagales bacterium]HNF68701.1 TonB family protein [Chitinophagales bacterium]
MYNPETYLNATINDIVFEDRNKAYGAYQLRKNESRYVTYAMCVGLLLTLMMTVFSLKANRSEEIVTGPIVIACPTDVDFPPLVKKIELPQPELPKPVAQRPTVAYTTMVAKDDNAVTDDKVTTIDDLNGKDISTKNNDLPPTDENNPLIEKRTVVTEPVVKKKEIIQFPEQAPEFNGGWTALQEYIAKKIRYPKGSSYIDAEGTVYVSFVVFDDGTIGEVSTVRGIGMGYDEEAEKVIASMPKWFPGKQNGNPVNVRMTLPIKFQTLD